MRRSAMNILLLNLAVADMLNLIIIVLEWYPAVVVGNFNPILNYLNFSSAIQPGTFRRSFAL